LILFNFLNRFESSQVSHNTYVIISSGYVPKKQKLGVGFKQLPSLLKYSIKSLQFWLGLLLIIIFTAILPTNLKALSWIAGLPLMGIAMQRSVRRISEQQMAQLETPQPLNGQEQAPMQNWQIMCWVKADDLAPFPSKWTSGQLSYNAEELTWQQSSLLNKENAPSINLSEQKLQVTQTRPPQGNEKLHIKFNFTVIDCQVNNSGSVLLAVPQDNASLIENILNSSGVSSPQSAITPVYTG